MGEDDRRPPGGGSGKTEAAKGQPRFLGSLRDALAAAGRDDRTLNPPSPPENSPAAPSPSPERTALLRRDRMDKSEMLEEARRAVVSAATPAQHAATPPGADIMPDPTVPAARTALQAAAGGPAKTQLLRGRTKVSRGHFHQDPVVGWLVVIGGPGLGAYRPVFEGNNTIGRSRSQRIPIDFGDDAISSEEQAYIRYDSTDRKFLLVPNLAKTNVIQVEGVKPTGAVELTAMAVITMGRTQLVFVPFCGPEFDWAELAELKE